MTTTVDVCRVDCADRAQYAACLAGAALAAQWQRERELVRGRRGLFGGLHATGWCDVCRGPARFTARRRALGPRRTAEPCELRNTLTCHRFRLAARQRLVVAFVDHLAAARPPRAVYVAEQRSPLFRALAARYVGANVTGSEFLGPDLAGGTVHDGIRHEDLQALSFADGSFDLHLTCDVLEHVPDHRRALREASRVLRPGGHVVFTIPWHSDLAVTRQRAALRDGRVEHLLPPQFHANPIDRRGSLVFWDHGWDLLDDLRAAGFADPTVSLAWSWSHALLGAPSQVIWARKV